MKMVMMYSCVSEQDAQNKSAELQAAGYRLDIFEQDVQVASADFRASGGGECMTQGSLWIVAGTKTDGN